MATKFAPDAESVGNVPLPTFLNHHAGIDETLSNGAAMAKRCMADILRNAEGVNARRTMVDTTKTRGANLREIERVADDFASFTTKRFAEARSGLAHSTTEAEAKLKLAVAISPTPNAREIRDRLLAMPADKRQAALRAAFDSGNKEILGAIVGMDPIMHGCDAEQVDALFDNFQKSEALAEYQAVVNHRQYTIWLNSSEAFATQFSARSYRGTEQEAARRSRDKTILASFGLSLEEQ